MAKPTLELVEYNKNVKIWQIFKKERSENSESSNP